MCTSPRAIRFCACSVTPISALPPRSLRWFWNRYGLAGGRIGCDTWHCSRHQDTIAVVDWNSRQLVWTWGPGIISGPHDPTLTFTDDIENVPPQYRQVGAEVEFQNEDGEVKTFVVSKIENGKLTVDANHPLAGKNLLYRVKLVEIREATAEERASGVLPSQGASMLH